MTHTLEAPNIRRRKMREADRAARAPAHVGTPVPDAPEAITERFEQIAIEKICESKTNPRRVFKAIDELAGSIKEKGIIEPLIVRDTFDPPADFELVAGARRLRGAKKAGLTAVPCIIRNYTDVQACEVQVIENNQREDVHPLEEASGFAHLIELGQDVATIAGKIGRVEGYVVKRLQLGKLIKPVRKMLEEDQLPLGHAMEIARLPEPAQERIAKYLGGCLRGWDRSLPELSALRRQISNDALRDLSEARWKRDDAELVPAAGACTTCLKNTANQRALFDDVDAKHPNCADPDCFENKKTAFVKLSIKKLTDAGEKPILLAETYQKKPLEKAFGETVHSTYSFNEVSAAQAKKLDGKVKKAVLLDGAQAGKVVLVPTEHAKQARSEDSSQARWKSEERRKQQEAQLETAINKRVLDACLDRADQMIGFIEMRALVPGWFKELQHDDMKTICARHEWKPARKDDYSWHEKACQAFCDSAGLVDLNKLAIEIALTATVRVNSNWARPESAKLLGRAAEAFKVDTAKLRKQVLAEQKSKTKAKSK